MILVGDDSKVGFLNKETFQTNGIKTLETASQPDIFDIQLLSKDPNGNGTYLFLTNRGMYCAVIRKKMLGKGFEFKLELDAERSYYEDYHVSCFAQVSTQSEGLLYAMCLNDKFSNFLVFDEKQKKFIKTAKNPSGKMSFLGAFPIHGTPLVVIRDIAAVSVFADCH